MRGKICRAVQRGISKKDFYELGKKKIIILKGIQRNNWLELPKDILRHKCTTNNGCGLVSQI